MNNITTVTPSGLREKAEAHVMEDFMNRFAMEAEMFCKVIDKKPVLISIPNRINGKEVNGWVITNEYFFKKAHVRDNKVFAWRR